MKKLFLLILLSTLLFANTLEKVSLQLKWKYQFQFAGFLVAKEKGFYKEVGLDVDIKEFDNTISIISDVIQGKTHFGVSDSSLIYESLKEKPVTAMMAIFQDSPFVLMGLKSSGIDKLKDIDMKKLVLHEGVDGIAIKAMLKANNINYILKPSVFQLDKLISGEIDMMTAYVSNEPYVAKTQNMEVITLAPKDYGFEGYGDILFTSRELIKSNPKMVEKMYQASYKGWDYAFSHMDEVVGLIYEKYNSLNKTKEALKHEALKLKELSGYGKNFGKLNIEKIKGIAVQFNLIKEENNKLNMLDNFIYHYNYIKPKIKYNFTNSEVDYLENKKELTLCVQSDFMPFEDIKDSKHIGLTSSYFDIFEDSLNIKIKKIVVKNRVEAINYLKHKKCDIVSINEQDTIHDGTVNTHSYIKSPLMVSIKSRVSFISDFKNLQNKKIGIASGFKYIDNIKNNYPNIILTEVSSVEDGLFKVEKGILFGQIGSLAHTAYLFEKNFRGELKIAGKSDEVALKFSMTLRDDDRVLFHIMEKVIKNLDDSVHYDILNEWAAIKYDKEMPPLIIYSILIVLFISTLLAIIFIKKNKKLHIAQEKIKSLNNSLENRVVEEVEKNRQQQLLMLNQNRLAQMGEIISMIAHQWRQPLNSLAMLNQTIVLKYQRDKLDAKILEYFEKNSNKQIELMSRTIDDFRDFFKPGKDEVEYCVNDVIVQMIDMLNPSFSQYQLNIKYEEGKKIVAKGFPNEFGQALINIINNAKDALVENDKNDKKLEITLKQSDGQITLTISDNARGIPEGIMEKIFDPYFSTKLNKNGTGLGLYMSKVIIEEHLGGKISVENRDGGACFTIILE